MSQTRDNAGKARALGLRPSLRTKPVRIDSWRRPPTPIEKRPFDDPFGRAGSLQHASKRRKLDAQAVVRPRRNNLEVRALSQAYQSKIRMNGTEQSKQGSVAPLASPPQHSRASRVPDIVLCSCSLPKKPKVTQKEVTQKDVARNLPLGEWSIMADKTTQDHQANLVWQPGLIKVQHVNSSTLLNLYLTDGCLASVIYDDVKTPNPLIHIHPSETAIIQTLPGDESNRAPTRLVSPHKDGVLNFKFDSSASDWNKELYSELIQVLLGLLVPENIQTYTTATTLSS